LGAGAEDDLDSRRSPHTDGEDGSHEHDDFESFTLDLGREVASPDDLQARVSEAAAAHGILRCKGFTGVDGRPMRYVLQAVGPRVHGYFDRPWRPGEPRAARLVVIGERGPRPRRDRGGPGCRLVGGGAVGQRGSTEAFRVRPAAGADELAACAGIYAVNQREIMPDGPPEAWSRTDSPTRSRARTSSWRWPAAARWSGSFRSGGPSRSSTSFTSRAAGGVGARARRSWRTRSPPCRPGRST
jgi:hypothetical protein